MAERVGSRWEVWSRDKSMTVATERKCYCYCDYKARYWKCIYTSRLKKKKKCVAMRVNVP